MPVTRLVRNIMVPVEEYPMVEEGASVLEAVWKIRESFHRKDGTWYGFQSLMVINDRGELVGILTLKSLLVALRLREFMDHILNGDPTGLFFTPHLIKDSKITVRKIMRPLSVITVQEDATIMEALLIILKNNINSLPVLSGTKPVGVVRTLDLFWFVGELLD
ncbi:CBS domain containing protein [Desulfocucumis palustris]|uniref:CBS domain containing protein n=1 Tax=Desulfocucumis palustris TaxID=1898651 RepID=A0A2L2XI24_9FIRM|nr:CBS domain-containing protein [Desulfocucumis palustris]GBF33541.1 CBS domain containing protein [Desulfocucumis palustris]